MINNKISRFFAHVAGTVTTLSLACFTLLPQAKALDPLVYTSPLSSFTNQTTELDGSPVLTGTLYNAPINIDVTEVIVTLTGQVTTSGTVKNNASQAQSFTANGTVQDFALVPGANTPAALINLAQSENNTYYDTDGDQLDPSINVIQPENFTSQHYTKLAAGASAAYGSASTGTYTLSSTVTEPFTSTSDIRGFLGTGTFTLDPYTAIGNTITGGGGNAVINLVTYANASLTIQYYGHTVVVPWNYDSASFIGMLVLGFGACTAMRRLNSNLHL